MENIKHKTAFISGATGALGKSIAFELAQNGCNLYLTSTNQQLLNNLVQELSGFGVYVAAKKADLNIKEEIIDVINAAKMDNNIDILVNCAGIFPIQDIFDTTDEDFDKTININLRATFQFTRSFAKNMVKQQWGRIVNIASSSAYSGFAKTSIYCASKHALLGFSRSIHNELKKHNVRTYCISPSSTKSNMGLATPNQDYSTFLDPDDVAKYIVFSISFNSNIMVEEMFLKRMEVR